MPTLTEGPDPSHSPTPPALDASPPAGPASDLEETLRLSGPHTNGRGLRIALWGAVATGVALAAIWWFASRAAGAPAVEYMTEIATRGRLVSRVSATGALEPLTQVDVGSEVSGIVESVAVVDNDRVRSGQTLAILNTDKLRAQLAQARASRQAAAARLQEAQASQIEARRELERLERMQESTRGQLPAQREIDSAGTTVLRAEAQVASATASLAQAGAAAAAIEIDLAKAIIRSPLDGIVLDRQVDPGQTVAASFQAPVLFVLAEDLVRMRLGVAVDEADIGRVRPGQPATFTVDAYRGRQFTSTVVEVRNLPETVSGVVTYEARLEVDNSELLLRPGMTATAEITVLEIDDALLVPNAALRFAPPGVDVAAPAAGGGGLVGALLPRPPARGGRGSTSGSASAPQQLRIWVLESGEPRAVEVAVGETDGSWTEILGSSLAAGTSVIVDYQVRGGS